jgi:hypothetical protein
MTLKWRDGVVRKVLRTKFSIWDAIASFFCIAAIIAIILVKVAL